MFAFLGWWYTGHFFYYALGRIPVELVGTLVTEFIVGSVHYNGSRRTDNTLSSLTPAST